MSEDSEPLWRWKGTKFNCEAEKENVTNSEILIFVRTFGVFYSGIREETTEISTGQNQVQGHTDGQHMELVGVCSLQLFLLYRSLITIKLGQVAKEMETPYTGLATKKNMGI